MDFWNFNAEQEQASGYESVIKKLKEYSSEEFRSSDEEKKREMVNQVFNIYRSINIFPITYFNLQGLKKEIKKCMDKDIIWDGKVLDFKLNQGSALCKFIFPNLHKVECKGLTNNSMWDRFYDDHKLKRAIELSFNIKNGVTPSQIRTSMELIGGNVATNFKIMNAKALFEKYVPRDGLIYDYACGFGGRLLGALCSKNNYRYLGVEPCTETYNGLLELGQLIESCSNRKKSYKILKCGSEEKFTLDKEFVDFAFSSPPYFTLEKYSDEKTQCYIKFPTLEEWFEGYVKPTIHNIYDYLKYDSYYAVNIADFKVGKNEVKYVDKWIEISKEIGFDYIENIPMKLTVRKGSGHDDKEKKEGIFIFLKNKKVGV